VAGVMAGIHRASWGAFKDSPYEGFEIQKYFRSLLFGGLWSIFLFYFLPRYVNQTPIFYIFMMVILLDTLTVEIFKLFFRTEDQKKYKIPSRLHLWKTEIHSEFSRRILGVGFVCLVTLVFYSLFSINLKFDITGRLVIGVLLGFLAGAFEAVGGMYKDAPFEGFEPLKFFRSPIVGAIAGSLLFSFQTNLGVVVLATFGADRMLIESYKTFVLRRRSGKFLSKKPLYLNELSLRKYLVFPYIVTWIYLVFNFLGLMVK